jgi:hypothetical protein
LGHSTRSAWALLWPNILRALLGNVSNIVHAVSTIAHR